MYFGATKEKIVLARKLRNHSTDSEQILWQKIRNCQIEGAKFRRQHPISEFIADFYCHEIRLVIEVDGGIHDHGRQAERDIERTRILNSLGITVVRFSNDQIINRLNDSLNDLKQQIQLKKNQLKKE